MKCVPALQLLHGRTNRERSSVPLAHNVYALVIEGKGRAACALTIQKLLCSIFPNLLHPDQAFTNSHRYEKDRLVIDSKNATLLIRKPLACKVFVGAVPAVIQHTHRFADSLGRQLLTLLICLRLTDDDGSYIQVQTVD